VPGLYNLARAGHLPAEFAVVGVGRSVADGTELAALHRAATARFSRTPFDDDAWQGFARSLYYVRGDIDDAATYAPLRETLARADRERGTGGNRLYYFAVPPSSFPVILGHLREHGLIYPLDKGGGPWSRVMIEKPFGRDLASARELNRMAASFLGESQI